METILDISSLTVVELVAALADGSTLVLCDEHNFPALSCSCSPVLVKDCAISRVEEILSEHTFDRVVAVGGCTVLDVGRAVAVDNPRRLVVVPTILSTTCISSNISILRQDGRNRLQVTSLPERCVLCLPTIMNTDAISLQRWCQSGFGDLFANLSASIDLQHEMGDLTFEKVKANVPLTIEAMRWVVEDFTGYDEAALRRLGSYLHEASLAVVRRGDTRLSSAGEHVLYHRLIERQPHYQKGVPTHGQIVSVGTLIALRLYAIETGENELEKLVHEAYRKLGLPLCWSELEAIGMTYEHLVDALDHLNWPKRFLGEWAAKKDWQVLQEIFGERNFSISSTEMKRSSSMAL